MKTLFQSLANGIVLSTLIVVCNFTLIVAQTTPSSIQNAFEYSTISLEIKNGEIVYNTNAPYQSPLLTNPKGEKSFLFKDSNRNLPFKNISELLNHMASSGWKLNNAQVIIENAKWREIFLFIFERDLSTSQLKKGVPVK